MAPQLNEKRWITRSQVDPVTAWNKQACYAAVRCVQAAGRGSMKGAMRSVQIGVTRCDDKCDNTVLLETQGPCGSVRRCNDNTVTHDTSVQGKCHKAIHPTGSSATMRSPAKVGGRASIGGRCSLELALRSSEVDPVQTVVPLLCPRQLFPIAQPWFRPTPGSATNCGSHFSESLTK